MVRLANAHPRLAPVGLTRLTQTYTLTPAGTGTTDTSYQSDNAVLGTPQTLPCLYDPQPTVRIEGDSAVQVDRPTLYVGPDDPMAVGDWVSNIKAGDTVLLPWPARVESITPVAIMGAVLCMAAVLRATDVHR